MCKFFSLCSQGDGKPLYFDAKIRKEIITKKSKYETTDRIGKRFATKIIDLSQRAFAEIANLKQGLVSVKVELLTRSF